jgi:hypothetical protein
VRLRFIIVLLVMGTLAGCGGGGSVVVETSLPSPSDNEITELCEHYQQLNHLSRIEMMTGLIDLAPPGYRDAIERESQREGSIEGTTSVNGLLERCDKLIAEE